MAATDSSAAGPRGIRETSAAHVAKAADAVRGSAVVIGEALVDIVHPQEAPPSESPGGSPLNVAITLARLGVPTQLVTALGDDGRADLIEEHLAASGVDLAAGARRLAATSTALARLGDDGSARYEFAIDWNPLPAARIVAEVVHAGSIALFRAPGSHTVHDALRRASQRSLVSIDPNVRPALLAPQPETRRVFEDIVSVAHVVKLSDEDAGWLYPGRTAGQVLAHLLACGPSLAALTRGQEGALLATKSETVQIPAPRVEVVDTIGAGDAFMGGLLHQLLERGVATDLRTGDELWPEELAEIGAFAARVAAMTVSSRGADPPRLADLANTGSVA